MIIPCPHCETELELDDETLAAMGDAPAFACPACQGEVPVPSTEPEVVVAPCVHCGGEFEIDMPTLSALRSRVVFPCPLCTRMLPTSMFQISEDSSPSPARRAPTARKKKVAQSKPRKPFAERFQVLRRMNRNLLILGATAILLLGGLGIFLASRDKGNTTMTREDRVREIVNNRYFTDLIASGKADKNVLLSSWDIHPYGTGYIGISGKTATWEETEALAREVGATVYKLDPPDAAARTAFLTWLPAVTEELEGETHWLLDYGEPKVISAAAVNRVSTMDRKRRVIFYWDHSKSNL